MNRTTDEPLTVKIPADVERPDRILYNLTGRQAAILAATTLAATWAYMLTQRWLPLPLIVALVFPIVVAGIVLAVGRRDGMSLDQLLLAAFRHLRRGTAMVTAPEGVHPPPAWCRMKGRLPAPLRLPVRAVRDDGVMDLHDGGTAAIVRAGTISFALRTHAEQAALVTGFGRWLNSLDAPVQILVQARPVDLTAVTEQVTQGAPQLPDPALERAALDHARFLTELDTSHDLLTRRVLIVLRDDPRPGQGSRTRDTSASLSIRRAEDAVRSLTSLGITAEVLDACECAAVLADSLTPGQVRLGGLAGINDLITTMEDTR
jgi:hypothetical protein